MNQEIVQCLLGTLNPDSNIRIAAELRLEELLAIPDGGLALSATLAAQDLDISLRQISGTPNVLSRWADNSSDLHSAGIILKKYVIERWSPFFSTFRGSAPQPDAKSQIRAAVFSGLSDPQRKIRSSCAFVLSTIAHSDWPEEYPTLLNDLIAMLSLPSPYSVHGAMQVFTEFISNDLTEDQILPVLRQLLPILHNILGSTEHHSAFTRARAVAIFRQCAQALFMVKEQHPQAIKEAVSSVMPTWLDAFRILLEIDPVKDVADARSWDALAVRIQIFKGLNTIHNAFPAFLKPTISTFLPIALMHLTALLPTFTDYYLSSSNNSPPSSSPDDPDMTDSLPQLGCPILDFVSQIIRVGKAKEWLTQSGVLEHLLRVVIGWIRMTEEDEENWVADVNAYISDQDEDTEKYTLRVAGRDLITALLDRMPVQTTIALSAVTRVILQESQQARQNGAKDWWLAVEACLASIDADSILECIEQDETDGRPKSFDIESLLSDIIPSLLAETDTPFLQGRAFVFASKFAKILPLPMVARYLNAAIGVLESPTLTAPVKVSAVRAIRNFCSEVDDLSLSEFAPRIAQLLAPFFLVTSEDTLSLVLDALSIILDINNGNWLTTDLASSLMTLLLKVWMNNMKDPILMSILNDTFVCLASSRSPGIYDTVIGSSLPTLTNALVNASAEESWIASSSIELVTSLLRGAKGEIGNGFFAALAPALFSSLAATQDRDVLQNGIQCLTFVIRKDHRQLLAWSDPVGRGGLENVLILMARLLKPDENESGGLFIGDLIIHLLRRVGGAVVPVLPDLLRAMLGRITTAKTPSFLQSLIIPFAYLIHTQRDTVLTLLESITVSDANPHKTGLNVLVEAWCENAETFQGIWALRTSNLGLCHLFVSERPSLREIYVKGDMIIAPETQNVIITRSKAKKTPHKYTSIPFPIKALKLLLQELQASGDAATITANKAADAESDDGDDEWADEEDTYQGLKDDEFAFLSGPGNNFEDDDLDDDREDEDLRGDPILQMNMKEHLLSFLRECAARNVNEFSTLVDQMTAEEILVIKRAVNSS